MDERRHDRPGWGSWGYVPETRSGSVNDPVESYLEGTDLGVRGHADTWHVVKISCPLECQIDEQVWPTALDAMREAERRAAAQ